MSTNLGLKQLQFHICIKINFLRSSVFYSVQYFVNLLFVDDELVLVDCLEIFLMKYDDCLHTEGHAWWYSALVNYIFFKYAFTPLILDDTVSIVTHWKAIKVATRRIQGGMILWSIWQLFVGNCRLASIFNGQEAVKWMLRDCQQMDAMWFWIGIKTLRIHLVVTWTTSMCANRQSFSLMYPPFLDS